MITMKLFFCARTRSGLRQIHLESNYLGINLGREPKSDLCHPYLRRYESAVLHGQAALRQST